MLSSVAVRTCSVDRTATAFAGEPNYGAGIKAEGFVRSEMALVSGRARAIVLVQQTSGGKKMADAGSMDTVYAYDYMATALRMIDDLLGEGYAKAHPELIAAYMITAGLARVAADISSLAEPLRSDHPLQGETFGGIEDAIRSLKDD
jgi:hypothetical protein